MTFIANIIKRLFYRITGGRPMIYWGYRFTDTVAGRRVNLYLDRRDGSYWLAYTRWSMFRMDVNESPLYHEEQSYN